MTTETSATTSITLTDLAGRLRAALRRSRKRLHLVCDAPFTGANATPITPFIVTITPEIAREFGYTADTFTYYLCGARIGGTLVFCKHLEGDVSFAWSQARQVAHARA